LKLQKKVRGPTPLENVSPPSSSHEDDDVDDVDEEEFVDDDAHTETARLPSGPSGPSGPSRTRGPSGASGPSRTRGPSGASERSQDRKKRDWSDSDSDSSDCSDRRHRRHRSSRKYRSRHRSVSPASPVRKNPVHLQSEQKLPDRPVSREEAQFRELQNHRENLMRAMFGG
jgi:hypothetical protein